MKKYWIIGLIVPFLGFLSCMDDTSAYLPQEKEDVAVDKVVVDTTTVEEELPDGQLVPGVHLVKLMLPSGDTMVERRFKYFMPISIDVTRPISLIFEFHGSIEFNAGETPQDPISSLSVGHTLCQLAIKENCIACFPAGTAELVEGADKGAVNWQHSEKHLPFVDAMVDYFKGCVPRIDDNRIYSTGQSSGAIFSFVLAFERSEVFAAITPRAGQMKLTDDAVMPSRAVPVRVFAGTNDETVVHSAVVENMTAWAERIGGYFASDMVLTQDSIEIEDYKKVDTRIWSGAKADYQIFSLKEENHNINESKCIPYMWEFMQSHTLDGQSNPLYITTSIKEVNAQCGQVVQLDAHYPDDAVFTVSVPKGWTVQTNGHTLSLSAPKDFFGDIERAGHLVLKVEADGREFVKEIPCKLAAPKSYFEVGDVYYNEDFEPVGVIYWVNNANIKEAMAISLKQARLIIGKMPADFDTPDMDNGYLNTQTVVAKNTSERWGLTAANSAIIWASELDASGEWYLPAINEVIEIYNNKAAINKYLEAAGGTILGSGYFLSSTTVLKDGKKTYYELNARGEIAYETNTYSDPSFAIRKVTKE